MGAILFNENKTDIRSMSPHAQLKFTMNSQDLEVQNDHGKIVYEINGGGKQTTLDDDQKVFLTRAIHEMIRLGHNADK